MTCYAPVKAFRTPTGVVFSELRRHDVVGSIELPCGQCIGCRMRRASDWELRVMHEASLWNEKCFVTLTYGRDKLPQNGSLCHRDVQLFLKRTRRYLDALPAKPVVSEAVKQNETKLRYYMCGEYGPLNLRPHYHACLFGVDFRSDRVVSGKSAAGAVFYNSPTLERLWSHGRVSVQDLTRETASYCARYIMKKVLGNGAKEAYQRVTDSGEVVQVAPEYAAMSLRPGIGAGWYERFGDDVFPGDYVVAGGVKRRVPRYYDKLLKRSGSAVKDEIEFERQRAAREHVEDQTPERLRVREVVELARVSKLKRDSSWES